MRVMSWEQRRESGSKEMEDRRVTTTFENLGVLNDLDKEQFQTSDKEVEMRWQVDGSEDS